MMIRFALAAISLLVATDPASAIIRGTFDGEGMFPADGALMIDWIEIGSPEYGFGVSCSGILISPTVFLTTAHCVDSNPFLDEDGFPVDRPIDDRDPDAPVRNGPGIWVSFDPNPADFTPENETEKCETCLDIEQVIIHPDYKGTSYANDLAVIRLKQQYGDAIPVNICPVGLLDGLKEEKMLKGLKFTHVGYGGSFDPDTKKKFDKEYLDMRMYAESTYQSKNKQYLTTSMIQQKDNGGTCYGDSGGATFYNDGNCVVGLTVSGDVPCVSTDKSVRLDIEANFEFISQFL